MKNPTKLLSSTVCVMCAITVTAAAEAGAVDATKPATKTGGKSDYRDPTKAQLFRAKAETSARSLKIQ